MSDIGKPKRIIEVEPEKEPARREHQPARPEPAKKPERQEPAKKEAPVGVAGRS